MEASPEPTLPWWNTYTLDVHHGGRWQIGPSTLWLFHGPNEWRVMHRQSGTSLDDHSTARVGIPAGEWADAVDADIADEDIVRFSFLHDDPHVTLRPALADRSVVTRPEHALHVPSGENVTLYVSTPLWIRIELGQAAKAIHEVPSHRPSDTWFGPSTREGELCYAARTTGRLRLEDLPLRPHRAVTPLHIHNRASDTLLLERVQIPTQHLALYESPDHGLWTQAITLHREEGREGADVRIEPGPPRNLPTIGQRAEPRQVPKTNMVTSTFKALGALFSP